jgi:cephalosporin hydroxylase
MYLKQCVTPSDIYQHLPTLFEYTKKCDSVVECGVRDVVSSYAFASALIGNPKNCYTLVDPYKSSQIDIFLQLCKNEGVNAKFIQESDIKCPLEETDLLFIDTWHVYGHLKRELEYWHSSVKKYIIMHDTTVDEWYGETIRSGWNAQQQSLETGIPVEEITKGLWPAIEEFLQQHPEWKLEKRYTNNNGLTILQRV